MSILTQYREKLHLKEVEQGFQQRKSTGTFTGLAKVGILMDATDTSLRKEALTFVEQLEKKSANVQVLAYIDKKEIKEVLPFDNFCKKDLLIESLAFYKKHKPGL